jgi:hypothetical protein
MPPPWKQSKKENETDDHNKSVHDKWMEGHKIFLSPEGQEEYNFANEKWKVHVRKHREKNGADIGKPISDVKSPYQMDPNTLVSRAHRAHLYIQLRSQEEEEENDGEISVEETKTEMDLNLAVVSGH